MQPLALYIHWPFCRKKCPYCDFNSHVREGVDQAAYRAALLAELRYMHAQAPHHRLSSIFFGGGTPSLMPPATAGALVEEAMRLWSAEEGVEITLEANPTSSEAGRFADFAAAGVNRLSLGVQSLRPEALAFLGREHSAGEALAALDLARTHFPRYSFDLIYALPGQSLHAWEVELREALGFAQGHLSLYQLTIEPNTVFHRAYHKERAFALPPEAEGAEMYALTQALMEEAGLPAYEISNHASPGQESRHNLHYWRGDAYAGVGPGAHGRLFDASVQQWRASVTYKTPERWLERVQAHGHGVEEWSALTPEERMEERVMTGLRLHEGFSPGSLTPEERAALDARVSPARRETLQDWLDSTDTHWRTTTKGTLLLNSVLDALLA